MGLVLFVPRFWSFMQFHALFTEARNQPTRQMLRQKLQAAMEWKPPGSNLLSTCYYSWLCLIPCLTYYGERTSFSTKMSKHWCLSFAWFIGSRFLNFFLFYWLCGSTKLDRGMSHEYLQAATKMVNFKAPWEGFGDPE